MLADVTASAALVLEELDQQLGVPAESAGHEPERGIDGLSGGGTGSAERTGEIAEQPGPAEAPPADNDTVAAGLGHHAHSVAG